MKALLQRVTRAQVRSREEVLGTIGPGLLVLLGIAHNDSAEDRNWLCHKIPNLRIFNDAEGQMNRSLLNVGGELLVVSQFTLHANPRKGNRPSYNLAAAPQVAQEQYQLMVQELEEILPNKVATGRFAAQMQIDLTNDGPVTVMLDSQNKANT